MGRVVRVDPGHLKSITQANTAIATSVIKLSELARQVETKEPDVARLLREQIDSLLKSADAIQTSVETTIREAS